MCFSPEADLIAGVIITVIGIDTLRHVEHPSETPLAALPLILGAHQLVEGVVWLGLDRHVSSQVTELSAGVYLAVAFGLLPWFIPWAARRMEPDHSRRQLMAVLTGLGTVVSLYLIWAVIRGPIEVADGGRYLSYSVPLWFATLWATAYVAATCGSLLLSTDRLVVRFGAINLVAVVALAVLLGSGVISLWCAWAAVASAVVALHLRRTELHGHRVLTGATVP